MSIILLMKIIVLSMLPLSLIGAFVLSLREKDSSVFIMALMIASLFEVIVSAIFFAK